MKYLLFAAAALLCMASPAEARHHRHHYHHHYHHAHVAYSGSIGGRPAGCPHAFCGCGASLHLFGRIIPSLNAAEAWMRFPRAAPAPRMAAVRRHHIFVLEYHISGNTWMTHDSNSGGGRTRLHARSIAGYHIVNPTGGA